MVATIGSKPKVDPTIDTQICPCHVISNAYICYCHGGYPSTSDYLTNQERIVRRKCRGWDAELKVCKMID